MGLASRLMGGWQRGLPPECSIKLPGAVCCVLAREEGGGQVGRRPRRHWPAKGLFQKNEKLCDFSGNTRMTAPFSGDDFIGFSLFPSSPFSPPPFLLPPSLSSCEAPLHTISPSPTGHWDAELSWGDWCGLRPGPPAHWLLASLNLCPGRSRAGHRALVAWVYPRCASRPHRSLPPPSYPPGRPSWTQGFQMALSPSPDSSLALGTRAGSYGDNSPVLFGVCQQPQTLCPQGLLPHGLIPTP